MSGRPADFSRQGPGAGTARDHGIRFTREPAGSAAAAVRRPASTGRGARLADAAPGTGAFGGLRTGPDRNRPAPGRPGVEAGLFIGTVLVRNLPLVAPASQRLPRCPLGRKHRPGHQRPRPVGPRSRRPGPLGRPAMRRTSDTETLNTGRLPAVAGDGMAARQGYGGRRCTSAAAGPGFRRVICLASLHGVLSRVQTFLQSFVRDGGAIGAII